MRLSTTLTGAVALCASLATSMPSLGRRDIFGVKLVSCDLSKVTLPDSHGQANLTNLSPPVAGSKLQRIGLGVGTQNYSCSSATATPVANGAQAVLYDISCLMVNARDTADQLPGFALSQPTMLASILAQFQKQFPAESLQIASHFFSPDFATPTFVDVNKKTLIAAKKEGMAAPTWSVSTSINQGYGAVDWLHLADKGTSNGYSEGYRVITAGGKAPPTCDGQAATLKIPYAAQYWIYSKS